ncbi:MAG: transporter substrate-binding domain-containing protein [Bacteroidetes bacterium]|nr:transporter substrate-binding domain-containing protein [Bacteroidota bacterium]
MEIIWDSKRNWTIVLLLLVIAVMLFAQQVSRKDAVKQEANEIISRDLDQIIARDTLRVITGNNSLSYFLYKGRPMGYEYELLEQYADHLNVHLEIIMAKNAEDFFMLLNKGHGDIIANNLTVTQDRKKEVAFADHFSTITQVLVQRLPEKWWIYTRDQLDRKLIRNPIDLIDRQIHVRQYSSHDMRLRNLSNEIGGSIDLQYHDGNTSSEQLIQMVATGKIDYTVSDNNVALMNATYFKNIDISTEISFPQRTAWAVRMNSPDLLTSINNWIAKVQKNGQYLNVYNKYFKNSKAFTRRLDSDFFSLTGGSISIYDEFIKQQAAEINWDWRLLAAQIYKESKFRSNAESWAGARGLMQLVPETAERFGDSTRISEPAYNILLGVRYLKWLDKFWQEIPDSAQRVKFILASYNVGEGHVLDARRLADKYDKNNSIWDNNVDSFLVKKAYPAFYRDAVVYNGYCRGSEPFNYVKEIMTIYKHYTTLVPLDKETG